MELIIFAIVGLFSLIIGLGGTVLWIWMLVDCLMHESDEGNNKIVWALVLIFTHALGALLYLIFRRPVRLRELGQ